MPIVDDMEAISRRMKEIAAEEKKSPDSAPSKEERKPAQSAYIDEGEALDYALSHDYGDCV